MLQTRDYWEYGHGNEILNSVFKQEGVRQYPMVEVTPGGPLIFVSMLRFPNLVASNHRTLLLIHNWMAFLDLLRHPDVEDPRVTLVFENAELGTYRSCKVDEIVEDVDDGGNLRYQCHKNGHIVYVRKTLFIGTEVLRQPRIVWRQNDGC